jgi:hypothetical protein
MAVPTRLDVHDDELPNAHVWIAGGTTSALLSWVGSRAVLTPGDAVLVIELGEQHTVAWLEANGAVREERALSLARETRFTAQGPR